MLPTVPVYTWYLSYTKMQSGEYEYYNKYVDALEKLIERTEELDAAKEEAERAHEARNVINFHLSKTISDHKRQVEECERKYESDFGRYRDMAREAQARIDGLQRSASAYEHQIDNLEQTLEQQEEERSVLLSRLTQDINFYRSAMEEGEECSERMGNLQANVEMMQRKQSETNQTLSRLRQLNEQYESTIEQRTSKINELADANRAANQNLDNVRREKEMTYTDHVNRIYNMDPEAARYIGGLA